MPERGENHDPRRGHATGSCRARDAVRYGLASEGCNKDRHHGSGETVAAIRNYIAAFLDAYLQGRPPDRLLTQRSPDYPDAEITLRQQVP